MIHLHRLAGFNTLELVTKYGERKHTCMCQERSDFPLMFFSVYIIVFLIYSRRIVLSIEVMR